LWEDGRRDPALQTASNDCRERWNVRINRARELQNKHAAIANALRFYEATLEFQSDLACNSSKVHDPAVPLRQQIDLSDASSSMAKILQITTEHGPDRLQFEAHKLQQAGQERWRHLIDAAMVPAETVPVASEDFFARATLQPLAENLQLQMPKDPNYNRRVCPACGGLPQLAVLRPEGDGASRSLMCSFCLCEWPFRRLICPWCGEENKDNLPRYSSEEWTYVHVEACDACQHYFKAVDMTIDGLAVPIVDEAALAVLDVWANGLGYIKIVRNMIGF
jgi:FdhE protein